MGTQMSVICAGGRDRRQHTPSAMKSCSRFLAKRDTLGRREETHECPAAFAHKQLLRPILALFAHLASAHDSQAPFEN